jgi:hypothetical protein
MRNNQSNLKFQNVSVMFVLLMNNLVMESPDANFGKGTWYFPNSETVPGGPGPLHYRSFTFTLRHTTLGRTPLDEWSAHCRNVYLSSHNTQNRRTSMAQAEFEISIPVSERQEAHTMDHAATAIAGYLLYLSRFVVVLVSIFRQLPIYNSEMRACYSCWLCMIDFPSH